MNLDDVKKAIKESINRKQVCVILGLNPENPKHTKKISIIIEEHNIDISHFNSKGKKHHIVDKICPKCGSEFESFGSGKKSKSYCSTSCANSREHSEETKNKISEGVITSEKYQSVMNSDQHKKKVSERISELKVSGFYKQLGKNLKLKTKEEILSADFSTLTYSRLRKRVLYEQDEKCNKCGLSQWLGKKLSLELEHKDGNNTNNERCNLEALCPNCHSLTSTWRGRNKSSKRLKISDEEIFNVLIKNDLNIHQTLLELELSPKGGNYKRCHRILREAEEFLNEINK